MFRRHPDDRAIAALAIPALGALAADPLYSLVDTALVGHLGSIQLGAVAIGGAAFTASFWIFSFLAYGVTPQVAGSLGAGDHEQATRTGVQALRLAVIAGVVVTAIGLLFAEPIVRALGGTGELRDLGVSYLRIRILSAGFVLIALVGHGWLRGAHDTRTPMIVAVSGAALNAVLDYLLIYPAGLGVQGAAWATVISQVGVAVAFIAILRRRFVDPSWRFDPVILRAIGSVGADLVVRTGALLAALTLATALAARMGVIELASWQIAMQIFLLLSLTMDSIAIAAQALVARHRGARDHPSARRVGNRLMELGVALGIVLGVVLFALRGPISALFTDDPDVEAAARTLIGWLALAQPVAAAAFTLDGILIGALETRFLAASMVGCSILFVVVGMVAYSAGWGTAGLAAGAALWLLTRTITTALRYHSTFFSTATSEIEAVVDKKA
jgi:MATE family multidrug resistance protein